MPAAAKPRATTGRAVAPTLEALAAKFDVETYRKNPRGFHYIPIEKHIERWQEVAGSSWKLDVLDVSFTPLPGITFGNRNPKPAAAATVTVRITATLDGVETWRSGVGGDFGAAEDVDKLVKTALAEAIKKTGNEFGIGLELWDEEERALIDSAQSQGLTGQVVAAASAPNLTIVEDDALTVLKNQVADLAVAAGAERTGPAVAAHFGVTIEQLQDEDVLRGIVERNSAVSI